MLTWSQWKKSLNSLRSKWSLTFSLFPKKRGPSEIMKMCLNSSMMILFSPKSKGLDPSIVDLNVYPSSKWRRENQKSLNIIWFRNSKSKESKKNKKRFTMNTTMLFFQKMPWRKPKKQMSSISEKIWMN